MRPPLKLFVCEFITGGGFNHVTLNQPLLHEGRIMRDALLQDLSNLPYQIHTTNDSRIPQPQYCNEVITINTTDDVWQIWETLINKVDIVWLIAPETNNFLERLTKLAEQAQKMIIGSDAETIKITGNKLLTYHALKQANIATLATYHADDWRMHDCRQWVAKPIDGAGCETTRYFDDKTKLKTWLSQENRTNTHIIQAFQDGIPGSIACLMFDGSAKVLSCNKQLVSIENNLFSFGGILINGLQAFWHEFEQIANKVAETFSGLSGYVGIDVIVNTSAMPHQILVVEVNPRLTTSFVGLKEATSINIAELCMNIKLSKSFNWQSYAWPALTNNIVNVDIRKSHAYG